MDQPTPESAHPDDLPDDFEWRSRPQRLRVIAHWWRRQQGICWICREKDHPMLPYHRDRGGVEHPDEATIEHLIPRRAGGKNTVGNNRLAHRVCNSAMGSLWQINMIRAEQGLLPLDEKQYLAEARANYERIMAARAAHPNVGSRQAKRLAFYARRDAEESTKRPAHKKLTPAERAMATPRGATLPDPAPAIAQRAPASMPISVRDDRSGRGVFDHKARPAPTIHRVPVCRECGSAEVRMDATLRYDTTAVAWVIDERLQMFDCRNCEREVGIEWKTVTKF